MRKNTKITIELEPDELRFLIDAGVNRHGEHWRSKAHAAHIARTLLSEAICLHREDPIYTVPHAPVVW